MTQHPSETEAGNIEECRKLLQTFRTVMMVTVTDDGIPRGRPMAMQELDALKDCDVWFVTSDASAKIEEIDREMRATVMCYRESDSAWVSASGTAVHERNQAEIKRLWKPDWKAWFPDGPETPDLCLIKINVDRGEYWRQAGSKLVTFAKMAAAVLQGQPADAKLEPVKQLEENAGARTR